MSRDPSVGSLFRLSFAVSASLPRKIKDSRIFRERVAGCDCIGNVATQARMRPWEFASVFIVSENYFKVLGVKALQGRTFESMGVPQLSAIPSVLISENYWQRRFAGDLQ